MKKIANIILVLFLISLIMPSVESIVNDVKKYDSIYDSDKTEKENEKSEEKEIEKNEIEFFDKILFSENFNFIIANQLKNKFISELICITTSQFKEIFTPPPIIKF